jgi:hypothetical protein
MLPDEEFSQLLSRTTRYVENLDKQLRERDEVQPNTLGYLRVIRDTLFDGIIHMDLLRVMEAYVRLCREVAAGEVVAQQSRHAEQHGSWPDQGQEGKPQ